MNKKQVNNFFCMTIYSLFFFLPNIASNIPKTSTNKMFWAEISPKRYKRGCNCSKGAQLAIRNSGIQSLDRNHNSVGLSWIFGSCLFRGQISFGLRRVGDGLCLGGPTLYSRSVSYSVPHPTRISNPIHPSIPLIA